MARDTMSLLNQIRNALGDGDPDFLREGVRVFAEALMEAEVEVQVGAGRYERSPERRTYRNGYREREWDTRAGTVALQVPKLRDGSYFPSLLEPRRRSERALVAVVQEAYVLGVSTRKVDNLVHALGMKGISKSQVSRMCAGLDGEIERFRSRRFCCEYPYIWLDATYMKVRENGRVTNLPMVIAYGVRSSGEREVLGWAMGPSETGEFWLSFLRDLVARELRGVKLVVSDAHVGLKEAIAAVFAGASWQRCRVHFMRNALARVPRGAQAMVAAAIRTIFVQPDAAGAHEQLRRVADGLRMRYPDVADLLEEAEEDLLAHRAFPEEHWKQLHSTNPLERLNKEIKRRCNVVGIFPNPAAAMRLAGALLIEQQDEWDVSRRYFSLESMAKLRSEASPELAVAAIAMPV